MAFVKLDTGILDSTLWIERECREIFITALLMAVPIETDAPMEQLKVNGFDKTGFVVPPGWYGFVAAAGPGIVRRAMVDQDLGMTALERLGSPEAESRSPEFDGRRLVRVDGGYIVLNFMKYRDKDHTGAIRAQRYRDRKKAAASHRDVATSHRDITQAEAEAEAEAYTGGHPPRPPVSAVADAPPAQDLFKSAPQKSTPKAKPEAPTSETWTAYGSAYQRRYGVEPVRNRTVNGQLAQFVSRVGAGPAPSVAAFYVESNRGLYVSAKHPINLLLRDAEGLHTEWATGQHGTETQARQADKTAANGNVFSKLILEARAAKNGT